MDIFPRLRGHLAGRRQTGKLIAHPCQQLGADLDLLLKLLPPLLHFLSLLVTATQGRDGGDLGALVDASRVRWPSFMEAHLADILAFHNMAANSLS